MYACMHACMYVCKYVCMYVRMCVCDVCNVCDVCDVCNVCDVCMYVRTYGRTDKISPAFYIIPLGPLPYRMQGIFCPSVRTYVYKSVCPASSQEGWVPRPGLWALASGSWPPGHSLLPCPNVPGFLPLASEAWPWDSGGLTDGRMDRWMNGWTDGQNIPCIL